MKKLLLVILSFLGGKLFCIFLRSFLGGMEGTNPLTMYIYNFGVGIFPLYVFCLLLPSFLNFFYKSALLIFKPKQSYISCTLCTSKACSVGKMCRWKINLSITITTFMIACHFFHLNFQIMPYDYWSTDY